jgi:ribonuclease BN (tRNA processing enzyme)
MKKLTNSFVYDIWNFSMKLEGTPLTLKGHSRGSEKTCFYIPELKTFLDAGMESYFNPNYIFITHCHSDHSFQLPIILTGLNRVGKPNPCIYAPIESKNLFQNFLQSSYELRKGSSRVKNNFKILGASPKMVIDLNKDGFFVKVYDLHHNVPTRGYGICQKRKKLNPKFSMLSGKELKVLKDEGININVYIVYKMVAYVLDTTIECFETNKELLNYRYVIVECTFFMNEPVEMTDKHINWNSLKCVVKSNPNVQFILVHFSMRYTWEEIILFFSEQKKELDNIIVWTN